MSRLPLLPRQKNQVWCTLTRHWKDLQVSLLSFTKNKIKCCTTMTNLKYFSSQCRKRRLTCHYPMESRRGMRKKKLPSDDDLGDAEAAATLSSSKTKKRKKNWLVGFLFIAFMYLLWNFVYIIFCCTFINDVNSFVPFTNRASSLVITRLPTFFRFYYLVLTSTSTIKIMLIVATSSPGSRIQTEGQKFGVMRIWTISK